MLIGLKRLSFGLKKGKRYLQAAAFFLLMLNVGIENWEMADVHRKDYSIKYCRYSR
jgi:hypothetical protein